MHRAVSPETDLQTSTSSFLLHYSLGTVSRNSHLILRSIFHLCRLIDSVCLLRFLGNAADDAQDCYLRGLYVCAVCGMLSSASDHFHSFAAFKLALRRRAVFGKMVQNIAEKWGAWPCEVAALSDYPDPAREVRATGVGPQNRVFCDVESKIQIKKTEGSEAEGRNRSMTRIHMTLVSRYESLTSTCNVPLQTMSSSNSDACKGARETD